MSTLHNNNSYIINKYPSEWNKNTYEKLEKDGNVLFCFCAIATVGDFDEENDNDDDYDDDDGKTLTMQNAISINNYVNSLKHPNKAVQPHFKNWNKSI